MGRRCLNSLRTYTARWSSSNWSPRCMHNNAHSYSHCYSRSMRWLCNQCDRVILNALATTCLLWCNSSSGESRAAENNQIESACESAGANERALNSFWHDPIALNSDALFTRFTLTLGHRRVRVSERGRQCAVERLRYHPRVYRRVPCCCEARREALVARNSSMCVVIRMGWTQCGSRPIHSCIVKTLTM